MASLPVFFGWRTKTRLSEFTLLFQCKALGIEGALHIQAGGIYENAGVRLGKIQTGAISHGGHGLDFMISKYRNPLGQCRLTVI